MGVTNLYPNLPGHLVEFKDGGLQLTTKAEVASGKSILILGTAFDGPINEPVQIDATTVSQLFGPEVDKNGYPNGATLTKYAKQAFKNGFTDVRCMRVTGSQAYVEISKNVSETSETVNAAPVTGTIQGNAAAIMQLTHTPIIGDSLKITTGPDGSGTTVVAGGYTEDDGTFEIAEGVISKNSPIYASYQYKDVRETPEEDVIVANDLDVMTSLTTVLYDAEKGEGIYVNEYDNNKFPATKGFKATLEDGTVLVEGTDYTINGAALKWLAGGAIKEGDAITTEYYVYTTTAASDTLSLADEDQVIELPKKPIAGSVVLTVNGTAVDAAKYAVADEKIILTAGNFAINDTFSIAYNYEEKTVISQGVIVRSIYGGSAYKDAKIAITEIANDAGEVGRKFTFTKPDSKKYSNADVPFYFTSFECPTIGALKQALANYALNNVFEIICDDEETSTADFPVFSGALAKGGDDGVVVTNNQMFEALSGKRDKDGYLAEQGAYQILENYNVDYIYPAGIYADSKQTVNPNSSFHYELALLCAVLTYRTKMTHGFIDVKPNSNTTLVGIQKHVEALLKYDNIHYMKDAEGNDIVDANGNKMDLGWYTSVVVGPEPVMISDTLGTYYGSPAIAYAALNGNLKPQSAPTNKALPGVKGMKYKLSNKQMNELVGNRMVVFKLKNEGTTAASSIPYVVDGCTSGAPGSDYARLATVKVVTDVVDQIREVADPFLGEPNTVEQRNALSALISKRLGYLMEQGEILHYEFEISATIQQVVLGECSIALTLVAPQELRKITTVVALRAAA
jgi:hypothetical protein